MIYVYCGLLAVLLLGTLFGRMHKKDLTKNLNKKEHPLRLFYPFGAWITDHLRKLFPTQNGAKVQGLLKSLYVKENVGEEQYLYTVKKTAMVLAILTGISLAGTLLCFSRLGIEAIRQIERNEPGGGKRTYELAVDYQDKEEVVEIPVDAEQYTKEEILALFDAKIEEIKKKALGENESADHVSRRMDFMTSYGNINIYWEIGDTDVIGYSGEIKAELEEDETVLLNLLVTLSMNDVSKSYNFPVVVAAPTYSEKELLISQIMESIEENNDVYEKEVNLPEEINGNGVSFKKAQDNNETVFLILGLLAVIVAAVGYDRGLENKVKKRKEQMMLDFSEIISKLSLLYEAGSSIRKAWEKIVADQEKTGQTRFAYQEMKLALEKIRSGVRERDAYAQFGKRCALHPYIKLGNILDQNLSKGAKGMKLLLKQEAEDSFEERKRLARKKGEEAGTKMLIPMILMMSVVVIIIAVPAFMSISL